MRSTFPLFRVGFLLGALLLAVSALGATSLRETLLAAKQTATDANYRNDQAGLRDAVASFATLQSDKDLAPPALYHAAWTEWLLAASQIMDKQTAAAGETLTSAVGHLKHALELRPDDAESHSLLVFTLVATATVNPARWKELAPEITAHRQRALELAPHNPRVLIMDATMIFYSRQPGAQEKGIARWLEAQQLFDTEKISDATQPDWGRTLADGWLANLYLAMTPPRDAEARALATKVLRERPEYWWVATQVLPKIKQP